MLLLDGQVHHDTHAIPMGNYVSAVGNYVSVSPSDLGNYMSADRQPYYTFRGLIEHLATLTRNQVRFTGTQVTIPVLAEPTSAQRQAFELIGVSIPLNLK